jgi:hypothetical protein
MMGKKIDLTGQVFNRLKVLGDSGERTKGNKVKWLCQCSCGNNTCVESYKLKSKHTQSCGCIHKEQLVARNLTHGMSDFPEYSNWLHIRKRCNNPADPNYPDYGGRGITVCSAWDSFEAFYKDMGPRPSPKHSIDRIDNNLGYSPENCRWATSGQQANNKRNNHLLTFRGKTMNIKNWAQELGVNERRLRTRLSAGWSAERALTEPVDTVRSQFVSHPSTARYEFNGANHTINEWAKTLGFKPATLYNRLERGWSIEKTLTTPPRPIKGKTQHSAPEYPNTQ